MGGRRQGVRVAVLTDCSVLRAGFEALIQPPEFSLVGFADNEGEMAELIRAHKPEVLIIPTGDGALEACASLSRKHPTLPILVLSTALDDASLRTAIDAGARGFLFKDIPPAQLQDAVRRLVAGESVLDTRAAGRVIEWATSRSLEADSTDLSAREREVLRHLVRGEPNKRIARMMGLSENTVKTYLRRIYRKLNCHTRAAAAAAAARRGLV